MPPLTNPTEGTPLHTPGPWHRNIKPARKYVTVWSGRNKHVAYVTVDGLTDEEIEANIDLIASAPSLLTERNDLASALRSMISSWEDPGVWGTVHAMSRAVSCGRLALAKAGERPDPTRRAEPDGGAV